MKKLMLSLALVTGLALASNAQDSPTTKTGTEKKQHTPAEHAKHGAKWATKNLGLTADQETKWEAAALERINANAPLREKLKGSTTPDERKAIHKDMKVNMEKFDANVTTFLTADQKTKWEKIKADKKAKHKGKKGEEGVDTEPEK
jgi:hypothetical protein